MHALTSLCFSETQACSAWNSRWTQSTYVHRQTSPMDHTLLDVLSLLWRFNCCNSGPEGQHRLQAKVVVTMVLTPFRRVVDSLKADTPSSGTGATLLFRLFQRHFPFIHLLFSLWSCRDLGLLVYDRNILLNWVSIFTEAVRCTSFGTLVLGFNCWHQTPTVSWWSRLTGESLECNRGLGIFWVFRLSLYFPFSCGQEVLLSFTDLFCLVPFAEVLDKINALGLLKARYTSPVSTDTGLNLSHIFFPRFLCGVPLLAFCILHSLKKSWDW